jgi:serine/threonine protein kinase
MADVLKAKNAPAALPAGTANTAAPTMTTPLTAQGSILGTFQYMAPEQFEAADADARADIWRSAACSMKPSWAAARSRARRR